MVNSKNWKFEKVSRKNYQIYMLLFNGKSANNCIGTEIMSLAREKRPSQKL